MDLTIILTMIATGLAIIGSNISLISWLRADMKAFEIEVKGEIKAFETEIRGWRDDFRKEMASYKEEIQKESKDFHGRLCAIEERQKGK